MSTIDAPVIKFSIPIKIGIFAIIGTVIFILTYLFEAFPDKRDSIKFFSIIVGSIGVAGYAAYYSIVFSKNKYNHEKIQHTIEFIGLINSLELTKLRLELQSYMINAPKEEEVQYEYISKNANAALALKTSLNLFESLSIAIQYGYVDEVVANKNLDFIIIYFFYTFFPYIRKVRKKNNDKFIYDEVDKLARSWKEKKYLSSGKKIIYVATIER